MVIQFMNQTRLPKRVKGGFFNHEALSGVTWADNHIIKTRVLEQTVLMVDKKTQFSHHQADLCF